MGISNPLRTHTLSMMACENRDVVNSTDNYVGEHFPPQQGIIWKQFCDISECSIRVCKYSLHGFH